MNKATKKSFDSSAQKLLKTFIIAAITIFTFTFFLLLMRVVLIKLAPMLPFLIIFMFPGGLGAFLFYPLLILFMCAGGFFAFQRVKDTMMGKFFYTVLCLFLITLGIIAISFRILYLLTQ